jgi:hypothetical protein
MSILWIIIIIKRSKITISIINTKIIKSLKLENYLLIKSN